MIDRAHRQGKSTTAQEDLDIAIGAAEDFLEQIRWNLEENQPAVAKKAVEYLYEKLDQIGMKPV